MTPKFIKARDFFKSIKETVYLYKNIWKEGTTTLLHAPREVDKTTTALSIASDLASQGREVLYINVDDHLDGRRVIDSDNLSVFTPEYESIDDTTDYADLVFEAIELAVRTTSIRTFVVDSVSRIAALSFGKNASPTYIMKRLVAMQVKCKLSILAVANDTTKSANNALLTLAASEITVEAECTKESQSVVGSRPAATATLSSLTRRERRAMERRMAKHPQRFTGC